MLWCFYFVKKILHKKYSFPLTIITVLTILIYVIGNGSQFTKTTKKRGTTMIRNGKFEFDRISDNDKTYQECLKMLDEELAPVMNECMDLVYHSDTIVPENKIEEFEELWKKCGQRYKQLPYREVGYNSGYYLNRYGRYMKNCLSTAKILCDKDSTKTFVTSFSTLFRKFRDNFHNTNKIPQFDI